MALVSSLVLARSTDGTDTLEPPLPGRRWDVLMLAIDDLRSQLACSGPKGFTSRGMHTPHLCGLAEESLMLQRSQVTMATCGPSRASLLTGRHPSTTRVFDTYSYWRTVAGNFTTIPQYFKEEGYMTVGMGKIFHPGFASGGNPNRVSCPRCRGGHDAEYSWTAPYYWTQEGPPEYRNGRASSWVAVPKGVAPLPDDRVRDRAVATLSNISAARAAGRDGRPFFVAVGFLKPHLPWVVPERFFAYYPLEDIRLPSNPDVPEDMPALAWSGYPELRQYEDVALITAGHLARPNSHLLPDAKVKELRRAYFAAMSYADDNAGQVISALTDAGLQDNTIVVVWSDHGWSLGEHGEPSACLHPFASRRPVLTEWCARLSPQACGTSTPTSSRTRRRPSCSACLA